MKLYKLLGAKAALQKIANSSDVDIEFAWEMADFIIQYNQELDKFETVKNKAIESCTENIDGEDKVNSEKLQKELDKIFEKEININVSFFSLDSIKKVKGLTPSEVVTIKSLLEDE